MSDTVNRADQNVAEQAEDAAVEQDDYVSEDDDDVSEEEDDVNVASFSSDDKSCVKIPLSVVDLLLRIEGATASPDNMREIASSSNNVKAVIEINCEQGNRALKRFLEHGADPNLKMKIKDRRATYVYTPLLIAIKFKNCEAIRILCEFGASFQEITKHKQLSKTLYSMEYSIVGYVRIDQNVLKTMLNCGYDIHAVHKHTNGGFLHFANARNVIVLAALGARYDVPVIKGLYPIEGFDYSHMQFYSGLVTEHALRVCCFLAIGATLKKRGHKNLELDHFLVSLQTCGAARVIMQSSYCPQPKNLRSLQKKGKIKHDQIKSFWEKHPLPLTLERLAANVVRTSLQPNAVVGVNRLVEVGLLPMPYFSSFITLGLTKHKLSEIDTRKYLSELKRR